MDKIESFFKARILNQLNKIDNLSQGFSPEDIKSIAKMREKNSCITWSDECYGFELGNFQVFLSKKMFNFCFEKWNTSAPPEKGILCENILGIYFYRSFANLEASLWREEWFDFETENQSFKLDIKFTTRNTYPIDYKYLIRRKNHFGDKWISLFILDNLCHETCSFTFKHVDKFKIEKWIEKKVVELKAS